MWQNLETKLVTGEQRRNLTRNVSEPNCHATKFFTENLLVIKTRKTQICMSKPGYFGLSILEMSKAVM